MPDAGGGAAAGMAGTLGGAGTAGGAGEAGSAAGSGGAGGNGGAPAAAVSFSDIYTGIIAAGCSCHNGGAGGLDLATRALAYDNLVNMRSTSCTGELRVAPGDPDASVLLHSLDHTSPGDCEVPRMPRGGAMLSEAQRDQLRAWIRAGAQDD
jgi:hypothetical protein